MTDEPRSFTIHDLPPAERPRERLQKLGADKLMAQELLAAILGSAGKSVVDTAQDLIKRFGGLRGLANASVEELSQVKGIGLAKACQIKAAFELAKRLDAPAALPGKTKCSNPEEVVALVGDQLLDKKKEYFWALLLDTRNRLIKQAEISIGSLDTSIVHPREVFKEAISASAATVIFVHNHPSGDPSASEDDIKLTKRLAEVGQLVGIEVLDHVIIGGKNHVSMKGQGLF